MVLILNIRIKKFQYKKFQIPVFWRNLKLKKSQIPIKEFGIFLLNFFRFGIWNFIISNTNNDYNNQ
ncbi:hypothetical protein B0A79_08550 [Flavobacterium piscis]|uniref:Uncharacterized protein n=1 Tax=Flavobacterium piscis TaxID=1114874 RepID=A0ABX2XBZ2_9FLAO|nr:hypothetical protein FLP_21585 [Flavobacterium piscis]OXG05402.1 hypothetical protein B0A79_08550 [Flavobacterium piscis]